MLVQVHALYPNGVPTGEHSPEEENDGWRCVDTEGPPNVYSLEGLPSGIVESLDASDSANMLLSISSAVKTNGNDQGIGNGSRNADAFTSNRGTNKIKINRRAQVSLTHRNKRENRALQQGERRLVAPNAPTGNHTLLVVRVSGIDQSPTYSASQLSDDVFGTSGDPANLVSAWSPSHSFHSDMLMLTFVSCLFNITAIPVSSLLGKQTQLCASHG